jgi:hypothetical protein
MPLHQPWKSTPRLPSVLPAIGVIPDSFSRVHLDSTYPHDSKYSNIISNTLASTAGGIVVKASDSGNGANLEKFLKSMVFCTVGVIIHNVNERIDPAT